MRYRRSVYGVLLIIVAALLPLVAQAQQSRRWLADPELITTRKVIGPDAGAFRETRDTVNDIDLIDATHGWAVSYGRILRFDGRWWTPHTLVDNRTILSAIAMRDGGRGFAVGNAFAAGTPGIVAYARFDGASWQFGNEVTRRDGSRGTLPGALYDVASLPDGTAVAVGAVFDPGVGNGFGQRPLLLRFDGGSWLDQTPDAWLSGGVLRSISMRSTVEGYAAGILGVPGGTGANAVRPAILRLQNNTWSEEPLPALPISSQPFSLYGLDVQPDGTGYAIFYDAGTRCPNTELLRRSGGQWTTVPRASYGNAPILAFALIPGTTQGWATQSGCQGRDVSQPDRRLRYDNGVFTPDTAGASAAPSVYELLSPELQFAAAGGAMLRYSDERLPTERLPAGVEADARYFPETGHYITDGDFLRYYQTHGLDMGDPGISARESLALFGYPVSELFEEINPDTGQVIGVQYFERARFEYHRENQGTPYVVLLGRLGANTLVRLNRPLSPAPEQPAPGAGCQTFTETPFALCPPFRDFWNRSGGLPVFGFPISAAADETSRTDGKSYLTQWNERERLEYHPENRGTPYEILLGLLASEELQARGYLPR